MRKILLITFAIYSLISANASTRSICFPIGTISAVAQNKSLLSTIEYDEYGFTVEFEIPFANLVDDDLFNDAVNIQIPGFGNTSNCGEPLYPVMTKGHLLPAGCDSVSVEIPYCEFHDYELKLAPARPIFPESMDIFPTKSDIPQISDNTLDGNHSIIEDVSIECKRGENMVYLSILPLKYNSESSISRLYYKFSYRINYLDKFGESLRCENIIGDNDSPLRLIAFLNTAPTYERYVIITHPDFQNSVNEFAKFKREQGYDIIIESRSNWTSAQIWNYLSDLYLSDRSLKYALLVGDNTRVPSNKRAVANNFSALEQNITILPQNTPLRNDSTIYVSDYPYSCLDSKSDIANDIYIGRLPVASDIEAKIVFDKIINYQKHPDNNPDLHNNGIHCAYFQVDNTDTTMETARFVRTSEDIRQIALNNGKNIECLYFAEESTNPYYWGGRYSFKFPIPERLRKPTFSWKANSTDIINAVNNGCSYILFRDHGDVSSWSHPSFKTTDIDKLNNIYTPVVFSIACLTGKFDTTDCFAKHFLSHPNGGCSAVVAASEVTYSGANDDLTLGMFDAIWPNHSTEKALNAEEIDFSNDPGKVSRLSLGEILETGLANVRTKNSRQASTVKATRERFHIFGDPSMTFHSIAPTEFNDNEISIEQSSYSLSSGKLYINLRIKTGDSRCYLAYNSPRKQMKYYGESIVLSDSIPADTELWLYGPNKIPKQIRLELYPEHIFENIDFKYTNLGNILRISYDAETNLPALIVRLYSPQTGTLLIEQNWPSGDKYIDLDISQYKGICIVTIHQNNAFIDGGQIIL